MLRLASLIYTFVGATVAGMFMVAALVAGMDTAKPLIAAALVGFVVAAPIAWMVAKAIKGSE